MQTTLMIQHHGGQVVSARTLDSIAAPHKCTKDAGNDLRLPDHRISRRFLNQQTPIKTLRAINSAHHTAFGQRTVDRAAAPKTIREINESNHKLFQRSN